MAGPRFLAPVIPVRIRIPQLIIMKFHIYGQKDFVELPENITIGDLQSLAFFNKIIKNYLKMNKIENDNNRNYRKI